MLERLKRTLPVRLGMAFGASQAGSYASALAFSAFMSMFPLILGVLAVIGLLISDPATLSRVTQTVVNSLPGDQAQQNEILGALQGVKRGAGWLGLVSIVGLLWGGTGLFGSMEWVLCQIFGSKQR